jgi:alkanesulfonate monooxygenase SsuD/methylene tetrahydromethanopterin reductase-like flavin-dependent oxidoreductase (luciferase family)
MFLSHGRIELGIGAGLQRDDYTALGLAFENARTRIARLGEGLDVIRRYFSMESVDFAGNYSSSTNHIEALPRCVQRPNPPILVGAGGPRMLDLAGRKADIVGIHARMGNVIDRAAIADLRAASIEAKIELVRAAARRPSARLPSSNSVVTRRRHRCARRSRRTLILGEPG